MEKFLALALVLTCGLHVVISAGHIAFVIVTTAVVVVLIGLYCFTGIPNITVNETEPTNTVGEQVSLNCSVSAFPWITSVSWRRSLHDGHTETLIIDQEKYEGSTPDNPHLLIKNASKHDEGSYVCTIYTPCRRGRSVPINLTVNGDLPSVTIRKKTYSTVIEDTVKLECSITAVPSITSVSWQHTSPDGQTKILVIDQVKYTGSQLDYPHLLINTITKDDEGDYVCTASNLCGVKKSGPIKLIVQGGPPEMVMKRRTYTETEGGIVVLRCYILAKPPLSNVIWKKGEKKIPIDNHKYLSASLECPSLVITSTEKPHDEGQYTCEAENSVGTETKSVDVTIKSREPVTGNTDGGDKNRFPRGEIPSETVDEMIISRHSTMVNDLSDRIYPGQPEGNWLKFTEMMKPYITPKILLDSGTTIQTIIQKLLDMEKIRYGHYEILSKAVYDIDKPTLRIIKDTEEDIEKRRKGVPNDKDVSVLCIFEGQYKSEQVEQFLKQIQQQFPEIQYRLLGSGAAGSIALTLTIKGAKAQTELSALYLANALKAKVESEDIILKEESDVPLKHRTSSLQIEKTDKPTVRLNKEYYQHTKGDTVILNCVVVPLLENIHIKWFRVNDGEAKEVAIDNTRYLGGQSRTSLVITKAKKDDTGLYYCTAGNSENESQSNVALVEIFSDDTPDDCDPMTDDDTDPEDKHFFPRLCHILKWPYNTSYGFDLDEDRKVTGFFIKTVDEGSPAESVGLRVGDRIVEVNSTNIEFESYQEVLNKVRAGNEIKLLVVDPESDVFYKSLGINVHDRLKDVQYKKSHHMSFKYKFKGLSPSSQITLIMYGEDESSLQSAYKDVVLFCDKEITEHVMEDPLIKDFSETHRRRLDGFKESFGVGVIYERRPPRIRLSGLPVNVRRASNEIDRIIIDIQRLQLTKEKEKITAKCVEWSVIEEGDECKTLKPYPEGLNHQIENDYQQQPKTSFTDDNGVWYEIDFSSMVEYPVDDQSDQAQVLRKDKLQSTKGAGVNLPSIWTSMTDQDPVIVIPIHSTDTEYVDVSKDFMATKGNLTPKIVRIERIQNQTLYQQYMAKKTEIDRNSSRQSERILWHGTAEGAVDSINMYGFNRSYCGKNATVFGDGIYFARDTSFSARDAYSPANAAGHKKMYRCRVLTGEFTRGQRGMRVPPPKKGHILYDSVVDDEKNPNMFIVFNDTQAYPEYLITFTT